MQDTSSRTLKFVFYALVAHGVLFTLMKLDQGSAYGIGSAFGRLVWIGIGIYAVRRLAKHGWGVTLFIVIASFFQEASALTKTSAGVPEGDSRSAVAWVLFALVNPGTRANPYSGGLIPWPLLPLDMGPLMPS